ncbi:MAG: cytochrome b/b6 domain-containing protein [Desulfobulbaceae bacterium]|nr:cytochrome b/b6 domain-containing protein [Desulfobulbaceae bacterium]
MEALATIGHGAQEKVVSHDRRVIRRKEPLGLVKHKMIYIHHAPIRVWHWVNATAFIFLLATGVQIRFAEQLDWFSLEEAIHLHNYVGFMVISNYCLWLVYSLVSGQIRLYIPSGKNMIQKIREQVVYYSYGIFRGDQNPHVITPENKFNVMQQQTYAILMFVLLPLQLITGLFLWEIKRFENYIQFMGGIRIVNLIHVVLFFFFAAFIVGHIYLATLGHTPLAHIKAMFTGYEDE